MMCLQKCSSKLYIGQHDIPASVGITGSIEFIELEGPEVILALTGKFWHRRGMFLSSFEILYT